MPNAYSNTLAGVSLAIIATLGWALNFVAPYVVGAYTIHDLMIIRFLIAGALGVAVVVGYRTQLRRMRRSQLLLGASLGVIGYLGYSSCIAAGVMFTGPVLTPAFIGMVPVLQALLGNATHKTLPWRKLAIPLVFFNGRAIAVEHRQYPAAPERRRFMVDGRVFLDRCGALVARIQLVEPGRLGQPVGQRFGGLDRPHDGRRRDRHLVLVTSSASV